MADFDFKNWLNDYHTWASETFGPGLRTNGVIEHITKELEEIRQDPLDYKEWIDVIILAINGAMRTVGGNPQVIIDGLINKLAVIKQRSWPDWRTMSEDRAIEHIKTPVDAVPVTEEVVRYRSYDEVDKMYWEKFPQ